MLQRRGADELAVVLQAVWRGRTTRRALVAGVRSDFERAVSEIDGPVLGVACRWRSVATLCLPTTLARGFPLAGGRTLVDPGCHVSGARRRAASTGAAAQREAEPVAPSQPPSAPPAHSAMPRGTTIADGDPLPGMSTEQIRVELRWAREALCNREQYLRQQQNQQRWHQEGE